MVGADKMPAFYPGEVSEEDKFVMDNLRNKFNDLAFLVDNVCPASRQSSLAMTKLEEAAMWANKAITHN